MTAERLARDAFILLVAVVLGLLLILVFNADRGATQRCLDKGYSEETCAWR